jgi:hypothetical protein
VIFLVGLLGLPLAYFVVLVVMLFKREYRGILTSLLLFAAAVISGGWAIMQSRSSTAGIGFLGLPLLGAMAGFLGLAFGVFRDDGRLERKAFAWVGLTAALMLVGFNISQGLQTKRTNRDRDDIQAAHSAEIARDRDIVAAELKENPQRQRAWLDSAIRAHRDDRAFLLAALPNDSISPSLLDTLASSDDMGIALEAVRNPTTTAQTLERVYRTKTYPDYFFQALAAHPHTPPSVLTEMYRRPRTIGGLAIWFAGNPATPRDILEDIARNNGDRSVIASLLENPATDCRILSRLAVNLMKDHNRDAEDANVARLNELVPLKCPNAT